jgi:integral membrane protein
LQYRGEDGDTLRAGDTPRNQEFSVDQLRTFRTIALIEATSFLLLLAATVVKYSADWEAGVKILGPVHGALFVLYVALAVLVRTSQQWGFWKTIGVLAGAVLPFGGFVVDKVVLEPALQRRR